MIAQGLWRRTGSDFFAALQFLTRIPVSSLYEPDSLARAVKFFPVVGLVIGACAALLNVLLAPHLPRLVSALLIVAFLALITGCLHEDGLADAADAFGGGWTREQILTILKDSRIGSYGCAALTLSLIARVTLLAALPSNQVARYLIASQVLSRWTTLPLSAFLPAARTLAASDNAGQGARIAQRTSLGVVIFGSVFSFAVAAVALRMNAFAAVAGPILLTLVSGAYYKSRIGGVTGDCFGATNQLTEIFVYLCGVWVA